MKKLEKENQYSGVRRPTVVLTEAEHKEIAHYCIEHDLKIGEFLKEAARYCMNRNIVPGKQK